jgi:hypothetical protein
MKRTSYIFVCLLLSYILPHLPVSAKEGWLWGKAGANLSTYSATRTDIATDAAGNVYTINIDSNIDIDGYFKKGYSSQNICIVSFDYRGNYRWSKMIGNSSNYENLEIKTDNLGGVYVSGAVDAKGIYVNIDDDAVILPTRRSVLFVKYDTSGKYVWHKMPEPEWPYNDGHGFVSRSMCVSQNGDIRILALMKKGRFCDSSYVVVDSPYSLHILSLDPAGNFVHGVPLDVQGNAVDLIGHAMSWDMVYDKFYVYSTNISQEYELFYGGVPFIGKGMLIGKFDASGYNEWVKYADGLSRITKVVSGPDGSVYIGCLSKQGIVFDGYAFTNTKSNLTAPCILKYDKDNNRKWVSNSSGGGDFFVFALSGNLIAGAGETMFGANVSWGPGFEVGRSFKEPLSVYSDELNFGNYIVTLDAENGMALQIDSLLGNFIRPTQMSGNKRGCFYFTGVFGVSGRRIAMPGVDTLTGYRGPTPFLVKYGTDDCDKPLVSREKSIVSELPAHPNPFTETLVIGNNCPGATLRLLNPLGLTMLQQVLQSGQQSISIPSLPSGMYLLELRCGADVPLRKIVIRQ